MVDVAGSIGGVVSPLLQVGEWLAAPIWRQFKYVFKYRGNFNSLQEQVDKLKNTRDEVQRKVTAAERNVQEIKQNVKNWQKDVEKTIIEAEQLIQQKANNPRCFKGLCPNFIIRYKQSKKAFKLKRDDIAPLHQQEKDLDPVSYPTNPPKIWLRSSEDYLAFESRNSTMKNVWDALNDNNVFMTGVYGMGGLGKTTLVQEAGRKAKEEKLFEDIVFVEISESPNIEKIQTTIADNLGLKFKNESDRADELYSRMNGKNILLILDNIWEPLEFEKTIGIPCRADRGRNKLLFTTRDKDVLEKMGSINNYRMDTLNEEEAWILFEKMAGDVIQTYGLNSLPNDICKECGGLPIVICTIAKALSKKRQVNQWQEALRELHTPAPTKFPKHLKKEYTKIKLSYDYLEDDDELKKTFIISSLMQNDSSILDLLKNIVNLGILEGVKPTIEEALNKLEVMVDELKDRCLLLDGNSKGRFSMHDVVRVVAVTCGYTYYHVYTEKNTIEREWKDKDKLGQCTIISLVGNDIITQLWSEGLNCPKLEFFQASQMGSSFQIPEGFLIMMPTLKVLNLFEMQQSLLSLSIDHLTNLQTLCLDGSEIEDVAIIGTIKKLKVLSLRNTLIKEFHTKMGQLTQLEVLDLSYCQELEVIAPNVISQLSKLEAFYIKSCSIEWSHGLLEEVKHLSKLTILELDVEAINVFPEGFFSKELKRYNISIGQWWWFHFGNDQLECWRILQFKFNSTTCLEKLYEIKNVEALLLDESSDEKNDTEASKVILQPNETKPLFNKKVIFTDLIDLKLDNISFGKIWESQLSTSPFENLTRLFLYNCNKIKYVFSIFIAKSLQQLRCLKIHDCKVLKKIVEEEEEEEEIEVVNSIFSHITQLELRDLPKLTVFYQRAYALELPLLKELEIRRCPNFTSRYEGFQDNNEKGEVQVSESKSICLKHKINSDLEAIRLQHDWEEKVEYINWLSESKTLEISYTNISVGLLQRFYNLEVLYVNFDDRLTSLLSISTYFQNLKVLRIGYCYRLTKMLLTSSITKSLVQLREMSIGDCGLLTEIVENERDETTTEIVFNNLNKLSLEELDHLTCFCSGNYSFSFPSLEELIIEHCPNMKTFSSGSLSMPKLHNFHYKMSWRDEKKLVEIGENDLNTIIQQANKKRVNSALEKLTLSGRDIMPIWQGEFEENFGKVKTLKLINDEHAYIPIHILMKFINLQRLKLKVSSYEEIFSYEEGEEHVGAFAQLKFLKLWGLFNLKCIWKQDFQFKSILQNLCDLTVAYCHNLTTLLPCSSSFKNLTTLDVIYCNGLQNLIASSIAKNLVCLEELKIRECEMMIEVLANEGDKEEDEIVFEKLKKLTLSKLKSLTCFYSGNYSLNFPFLKSLNVDGCFKMKTFSRESFKMPRLQKVNEKVCAFDLNSVIQQIQNGSPTSVSPILALSNM